jgi:hypothetical protein
MTDINACRDDIVFFGSRAAAGDISPENAALLLVEATFYRMGIQQARQAIDTWQGYLARPVSVPAARRAFLSRLFTRKQRTTIPKENTI